MDGRQAMGAGTAVAPTNGKAMAALILGIVGIVFLPIIASVIAIVLGTQARREVDASGMQGRELATVGIVLGWVGVGIGVFMLLLFMFIFGLAAWLSGP